MFGSEYTRNRLEKAHSHLHLCSYCLDLLLEFNFNPFCDWELYILM
jgi:hypothetical protein